MLEKLFTETVHRKCLQKLSTENVHRNFPQKLSTENVHRNFPQKLSTETFHRNCPQKMSTETVHRKCPQKMSTELSKETVHRNCPHLLRNVIWNRSEASVDAFSQILRLLWNSSHQHISIDIYITVNHKNFYYFCQYMLLVSILVTIIRDKTQDIKNEIKKFQCKYGYFKICELTQILQVITHFMFY